MNNEKEQMKEDYIRFFTTTIDEDGSIEIPKEIMELYNLKPGDIVSIQKMTIGPSELPEEYRKYLFPEEDEELQEKPPLKIEELRQ